MTTLTLELTDTEIRAVADEHSTDTSGYAPADLAIYKFVQACVAATAQQDAAEKAGEEPRLATPNDADYQHAVDHEDAQSGGDE